MNNNKLNTSKKLNKDTKKLESYNTPPSTTLLTQKNNNPDKEKKHGVCATAPTASITQKPQKITTLLNQKTNETDSAARHGVCAIAPIAQKTQSTTLLNQKNTNPDNDARHGVCATAPIIAQCTAEGVGAIGVIRISGEGSWGIIKQLVRGMNGEIIDEIPARKMVLCRTEVRGIRDKVMVVRFEAPRSYTGEEVVEIQIHGNAVLSGMIISEAVKRGARVAEGGEFTKRAMLNNKIDLSEAEGILSVINASAESELRAAAESSDGELYKKVNELFNKLIELGAKAESAIDYPEEDLEEVTENELSNNLQTINKELLELIKGFDNGRVLREGALIVIAGETNVGKSTLLNKIIGYDRAIVSDEAGTTRDTLTESYIYNGVKFNICDTAGIRKTTNKIEALGIERSNKQIDRADIIIALTEKGKPFNINLPKNKKILYVSNKEDLFPTNNQESFINNSTTGVITNKENNQNITNNQECPINNSTTGVITNKENNQNVINNLESSINNSATGENTNSENNQNIKENLVISALTNKNVDKLKEMIYTIVMQGISSDGVRLNNFRQQEACRDCQQSIARALQNLGAITIDCIASDIKAAATALGKITGKTASAEIITEIFKKFCVGK